MKLPTLRQTRSGTTIVPAALAALGVLSALTALPAPAQELGKHLQEIKDSSTLKLGVRDSAVPFSFIDAKQVYQGYSVDLCLKVAETIQKKLNIKSMNIRMVPVTSATRIPMLLNGSVDIVCDPAVNNAERQKQVAFSVTHFVSATPFVARKSAHLQTLDDLKGKTVVAVARMSSLRQITELNAERNLGMTIEAAQDAGQAFQMVENGSAAAMVGDDIQLYAQVAKSRAPKDYQVSADALSFEPAALMLPKDDPAFKKVVDDTLIALYKGKEFKNIYARWFLSPSLADGLNLNMPESAQLQAVRKKPTDSGDPADYGVMLAKAGYQPSQMDPTTLWVMTDGGCKAAWNDAVDPELKAQWSGACNNGYAEGPGILTWLKNGTWLQRFEGDMARGKRSGTGDYYWANGDHYRGQFTDDLRTGQGTYEWPNGTRYTGAFVAGKIEGNGATVSASGLRYEGLYKQGKPFEGKEYDRNGTQIALYSQGRRQPVAPPPAAAPATASGSSGGSGLGGLLGALGAVAQGVGSTGGQNAGKWQAAAAIAQSASGASPEQVQAALDSARASSALADAAAAARNPAQRAAAPVSTSSANVAPAAAGNANLAMNGNMSAATTPGNQNNANGAASAKDPFVYAPSVNECLVVENHPTLVGSKGLRNRCGYKINYTFCEYRQGSDGNVNDECQKQVFGAESLNPGGSTYLIAATKRIYYIACKDPYYTTGSKLTWDGSALHGRCQMAR